MFLEGEGSICCLHILSVSPLLLILLTLLSMHTACLDYCYPNSSPPLLPGTPKHPFLYPLLFCWGADWFYWLSPVQVYKSCVAISSWMQWLRHIQKTACHSTFSHPLALTFFLSPLPLCSLSLGCVGLLTQLSHLGMNTQLWPVISVCTNCRQIKASVTKAEIS